MGCQTICLKRGILIKSTNKCICSRFFLFELHPTPCHPERTAKEIITIPQVERTLVKEVRITVSKPLSFLSFPESTPLLCVENVLTRKDTYSRLSFMRTDSNSNGSYYYSNDNGSKYYNSGSGYSSYTPSGGSSGGRK